MAAIVLVHGIDHQSESADLIENHWLPALAGGVRLAGRGDLADRLWPRARGPTRSSAGRRITAGCSARPTSKGPGRTPATGRRSKPPWPRPSPWNGSNTSPSVPPPEAPTPSRPASRSTSPETRQRAGAMGGGNVLRQALKTLARVSWLANAGMYVAERLFVTSLAQVTRYLTDEATREQAREAVLGPRRCRHAGDHRPLARVGRGLRVCAPL